MCVVQEMNVHDSRSWWLVTQFPGSQYFPNVLKFQILFTDFLALNLVKFNKVHVHLTRSISAHQILQKLFSKIWTYLPLWLSGLAISGRGAVKAGWLFGRAWVRIPPLPACRIRFLHEIILGQGTRGSACVLVKLWQAITPGLAASGCGESHRCG